MGKSADHPPSNPEDLNREEGVTSPTRGGGFWGRFLPVSWRRRAAVAALRRLTVNQKPMEDDRLLHALQEGRGVVILPSHPGQALVALPLARGLARLLPGRVAAAVPGPLGAILQMEGLEILRLPPGASPLSRAGRRILVAAVPERRNWSLQWHPAPDLEVELLAWYLGAGARLALQGWNSTPLSNVLLVPQPEPSDALAAARSTLRCLQLEPESRPVAVVPRPSGHLAVALPAGVRGDRLQGWVDLVDALAVSKGRSLRLLLRDRPDESSEKILAPLAGFTRRMVSGPEDLAAALDHVEALVARPGATAAAALAQGCPVWGVGQIEEFVGWPDPSTGWTRCGRDAAELASLGRDALGLLRSGASERTAATFGVIRGM